MTNSTQPKPARRTPISAEILVLAPCYHWIGITPPALVQCNVGTNELEGNVAIIYPNLDWIDQSPCQALAMTSYVCHVECQAIKLPWCRPQYLYCFTCLRSHNVGRSPQAILKRLWVLPKPVDYNPQILVPRALYSIITKNTATSCKDNIMIV